MSHPLIERLKALLQSEVSVGRSSDLDVAVPAPVNLLPPEFLPKPLLTQADRWPLAAAAVMLLLCALLGLRYVNMVTPLEDLIAQQEDAALASYQEDATGPTPSDADLLKLQSSLEDQRKAIAEYERVLKQRFVQVYPWSKVLVSLYDNAPDGLVVTQIDWAGSAVSVSGLSVDRAQLVAYSAALQGTGLFRWADVSLTGITTQRAVTDGPATSFGFTLVAEVVPLGTP